MKGVARYQQSATLPPDLGGNALSCAVVCKRATCATFAETAGFGGLPSEVASVAKYRATIWHLISLVLLRTACRSSKNEIKKYGKISNLYEYGERGRKTGERTEDTEEKSLCLGKLWDAAFSGDVAVKVSLPRNGGSG